ncbi:hypothetical protein OG226_01685 [Streptomyces sp. NBC_01261]|uniref:hypothetical protein n=1 Tax=Streptomyces sp. NBC_01261 TaxID=2903802 RepID=UPI002E2FA43A|nr:hypothetical protein [Streptomyces sp. NBC_01261]
MKRAPGDPWPAPNQGRRLQLVAELPALPGPFGAWTDNDDQEHEEPKTGPDGAEPWC